MYLIEVYISPSLVLHIVLFTTHYFQYSTTSNQVLLMEFNVNKCIH